MNAIETAGTADDDHHISEAAWTKAGAASPAFDFLKDAAEDIYTASDGKPFTDQE